MKKCFFRNFGIRILPGMLAAVLFACQSKTAVFMPYDDIAAAPGQTVYASNTLATENGKSQVFMEYPVMHNYTGKETGKPPMQVFPRGIRSIFYSETGNEIDVLLLADSAINMQKEKLMKFFHNVEVYDYRSMDTIYTEALYWNQETKKIYSDVFVRKVSPGLVLEGDGFDSDERMENVVLRRPRGVIR